MCGAELKTLPEGVQRVAAALESLGHPHRPQMLDDAARTAQQAADALGIAVGQIAKSIIFRRKSDDVAVLVVTSGDRRVDEKKVEAHVGGKIGRADADFVKSRTVFPSAAFRLWRTPRRPSRSSTRTCCALRWCGRPQATRMACLRCTPATCSA